MSDSENKKFIGYSFIKRNTRDGILLEIWQDMGNNTNNPANSWKLISSEIQKENNNWSKPKEKIEIDIDKYNPMSHKRYDDLREKSNNGDVGAMQLLDGMAELYERHKQENPIEYKRSIENDLNEVPDFMEPKLRIDDLLLQKSKWVNLKEDLKDV